MSEENWGETYSVQTLHTCLPCGRVTHLKVRRHDGKDINCTWDVLQRIKTDMLGEDALAVEFYPPESQIVNEANIRHLWVFPPEIIPDEYLPLQPK